MSQTIQQYCQQSLPELYNKCKETAGTDDAQILGIALICYIVDPPSNKKFLRTNCLSKEEKSELILKSIVFQTDLKDLNDQSNFVKLLDDIKTLYGRN